MFKKVSLLISVVFVLSLAANAMAADLIWDNNNGTGDRLWHTPTNWKVYESSPVERRVPDEYDWAIIDDDADASNGPIINPDTNEACAYVEMGCYQSPTYQAYLTMTGGRLDVATWFELGGYEPGDFRFDMSSGTLNIGGNIYLSYVYGANSIVNISGDAAIKTESINGNGEMYVGWTSGTTATVNISGGTLNIADDIELGVWDATEGYINMTGGQVTIGDWLDIGAWTDEGGYGHLDLHGGTIHTYDLSIGPEGHLDITEGVLTADADLTVSNGYLYDPENDTPSDEDEPYTGTVPILIARGIITAYDINSGQIITDDVNYPAETGRRAVVNVDYDVTNPGKTTLWATTIDPNIAWNPRPSSGSIRQPQLITLSWSDGLNAAAHDVYFGTSFDDVYNGTGGTLKEESLDTNSYSPGISLVLDTTYYWRIDEVNASGEAEWKGMVWNFKVAPGIATDPYPEDGATDISPDVDLYWTPGVEAFSHELYFSADFNDVNERLFTPATPSANSYDPSPLEFDTTYYWAVDEVNLAADVNTWYGDIWQFTTASYLVVDDMESYGGDVEIYDTWLDGYWLTVENGSWLFLDTLVTYDGNNSMRYQYDNDYKFPGNIYGSWAEADTAKLEIGPDWTLGGAKALRLFFYGDPTNSTTVNDKMYIALHDDANVASAYYPDVNDINEESWHEWQIDLEEEFSRVNLSSVSKVSIGFGIYGGGSQGGKGTVYFDNIEVWPPWCRSELVPTDITNDCTTDIEDLEILSNDWLIQDYNYIAAEPCEANLIGWWKFDEGTGKIAEDSSLYENDGNVIQASWTTGYPGDPFDSALDFDGDGVAVFDRVIIAEREGNTPGIYPAELMPSDAFTIVCWTKLDSFGYFDAFVSNAQDTGSDECGFALYNGGWEGEWGNDFGFMLRTQVGDMSYIESDGFYDTDIWYHVAGTYDGSEARLYVDGQLATVPVDVGGPMLWESANLGNYPQAFLIGKYEDDNENHYVQGTIDDVRFYNYALSQGEIALIVEAIPPGTDLYQPVPSLANITDPEPQLSRKVNFADFAIMADDWLIEQLWP